MNFDEVLARKRELVGTIEVVEDPGYDVSRFILEAVRLGVHSEVKNALAQLEARVYALDGLARTLRAELERERVRNNALSEELHELIARVSGGDRSLPVLKAYVGIQLYAGNPVPPEPKLARLFKAVEGLAAAIGLDLVDDPEAISGSVLKRWWYGLRRKIGGMDPDQAIDEVARKAKLALELRVLDGPQADVTAKLVHAGAEMIAAMKDCDGPMIMRIGNLLALQAEDGNGVMCRLVTELSPLQARWLLEHPAMLFAPSELLRWLQTGGAEQALPDQTVVSASKLSGRT